MPIFDPAALNPGVRPREVVAWAGYDFANSGYTTVVLTAVFNAYFVGVVAANADWATFAWTLTLGISNALVMLAMPMIGAYADLRARKKWLLARLDRRLRCRDCRACGGRPRRCRAGDRRDRHVSNFFFMVGVGLDRGISAGAGAARSARQGLRLGLGFRLCRRPHHAGAVPGLRAMGAGDMARPRRSSCR